MTTTSSFDLDAVICHRARHLPAGARQRRGRQPPLHGKTGLYEAVLRSALLTMRGTTEAAQHAGADRPPAEQLEVYIAIFLRRVVEGRDSWIHRLMMHELSDPTPALDLVVNDVLRPRMAYLTTIIAALIGSSEADPRVARCLMSVHAQIQALLVKNPLVDRLSPFGPVTPDSVDAIARHISRCSLAGIRAMADRSQ